MSSVQALIRHDDLYPEYEVSKDGLKVSEAEYWKTYYEDPDFVYEWNNGFLEVRPMADLKGSKAYRWFLRIMDCYFSTFPIGEIVTMEIGFRLNLPQNLSVRIPDLAVVLDGNSVKIDDDDRSYKGTFDLCVESLSHSVPSEILRDTVTKKREYESIGVKEYYILDARGHETAFYHLDNTRKYQKIKHVEGDIIKSGILPGFQFRESDLYRQPSLKEMTGDEVYCHYAFPAYMEEKQRADKEKQRADNAEQRADEADQRTEQEKQRADQADQRTDQEKQRADQAESRIEQMTAKLRELGISPA